MCPNAYQLKQPLAAGTGTVWFHTQCVKVRFRPYIVMLFSVKLIYYPIKTIYRGACVLYIGICSIVIGGWSVIWKHLQRSRVSDHRVIHFRFHVSCGSYAYMYMLSWQLNPCNWSKQHICRLSWQRPPRHLPPPPSSDIMYALTTLQSVHSR